MSLEPGSTLSILEELFHSLRPDEWSEVDAFVAALPGGKVPDRDDFLDYAPDERVEHWYAVIDRCRVLAEELAELIETGRVAERVEAFPA